MPLTRFNSRTTVRAARQGVGRRVHQRGAAGAGRGAVLESVRRARAPQSPQRAPQQQQQQYNPFGGFFGSGPGDRRPQGSAEGGLFVGAAGRRAAPPESTAAITSPILVLGDAMADWLAYGLEDAFSERPEFGIVRKHRTFAGLVRYDPRRDVEWPQIVREAIAADKPKFIVMMVGFHDRQAIRERAPATAGARLAPPAPAGRPRAAGFRIRRKPREGERRGSRTRKCESGQAAADRRSAATPAEGGAGRTDGIPDRSLAGRLRPPHRRDHRRAQERRTCRCSGSACRRSAIPASRPPRSISTSCIGTRAERAGIVFVDIWDGFVDEAGRYVLQGPDFEGQIRRLRSGDGLYFTRAGARKLAHYVEREILRSLVARQTPVALPAPEPAVLQPGRGSARPLAGPVIPLTAAIGGGNELLGGGPARPSGNDPLATRVLVRGEPVTAPAGRADNFAWPRSGVATIREGEPEEVQPARRPQPPAAAARRPAVAAAHRADAATSRAGAPAAGGATTPQTPAAVRHQASRRLRPLRRVRRFTAAATRRSTAPAEAKQQPAPQRKAPPATPAPPRASNDSVPRPPLNIAR